MLRLQAQRAVFQMIARGNQWIVRRCASVGGKPQFMVEHVANQGKVIQGMREQCREHLRACRDFAFNATNITRQTRKRWIDLFADYRARVALIYLEPPLPMIFERNEHRTKPVPRQVIHQLVKKLEPPTWAEAHSVTLIG